MQDYKKQATDFLTKHGATITIEKSKNQSSPLWAKKDDNHGIKYDITISRGNRNYSFNFWDSVHNKQEIEKADKAKYFINKRGWKVYQNEFGFEQLQREHYQKVENGDFTPSAYDVLSCLTKYEIGTFEDFCGDFGYDEDSKTAEKTFIAVTNEYYNVRNIFGDVMEELQEIN